MVFGIEVKELFKFRLVASDDTRIRELNYSSPSQCKKAAAFRIVHVKNFRVGGSGAHLVSLSGRLSNK